MDIKCPKCGHTIDQTFYRNILDNSFIVRENKPVLIMNRYQCSQCGSVIRTVKKWKDARYV